MRPLALLLLPAILSCSEDEVVEPPIDNYRELTSKNHVIQNLEASYRDGDMGQVQRVMHESFSFCFTLNLNTRCWFREDELTAIGEVLAGGGIDVEFSHTGQWIANASDPRYGEAIWEKLVTYTIKRGRSATGLTVLAGQATFLIRSVEFEGARRWRLTGIADHTGPWGEFKEQYLPEN